MRLTSEQLRHFDEQGYVFFPNCFSAQKFALLAFARERRVAAE